MPREAETALQQERAPEGPGSPRRQPADSADSWKRRCILWLSALHGLVKAGRSR